MLNNMTGNEWAMHCCFRSWLHAQAMWHCLLADAAAAAAGL